MFCLDRSGKKHLLYGLILKAGSRWSGTEGVNVRSKHSRGISHSHVNKLKYQCTKRITVHEVMKSTIPPTLCSTRHTWLPIQVNQLKVKDLQLDCPPVSLSPCTLQGWRPSQPSADKGTAHSQPRMPCHFSANPAIRSIPVTHCCYQSPQRRPGCSAYTQELLLPRGKMT